MSGHRKEEEMLAEARDLTSSKGLRGRVSRGGLHSVMAVDVVALC